MHFRSFSEGFGIQNGKAHFHFGLDHCLQYDIISKPGKGQEMSQVTNLFYSSLNLCGHMTVKTQMSCFVLIPTSLVSMYIYVLELYKPFYVIGIAFGFASARKGHRFNPSPPTNRGMQSITPRWGIQFPL